MRERERERERERVDLLPIHNVFNVLASEFIKTRVWRQSLPHTGGWTLTP